MPRLPNPEDVEFLHARIDGLKGEIDRQAKDIAQLFEMLRRAQPEAVYQEICDELVKSHPGLRKEGEE